MDNTDLKPIIDTIKASSILIIPRMLYKGFILYFCWMWFAIPYGLPELDYWTATVMGGVTSVLTFEHIGQTHNTTTAFRAMMEWMFGASVFLAVAFLIHFGITYGVIGIF